MTYKSKEAERKYNSKYFKERYTEDEKFRERRREESKRAYHKKKRYEYIVAIEYFRDLLAGGEPADMLVDKVMAKYKIVERK